MTTRPDLLKKWQPILEAEGVASIKDSYRKEVTAVLLENQERALKEERQSLFETPTNVTGSMAVQGGGALGDGTGVTGFDPILISLVRRSAPQLIAYDLCGVQPMTQPTGLIFAMKSRYNAPSGVTATEALFNEADTSFSGAASPAHTGYGYNGSSTGTGQSTATGEAGSRFNEMAFSIEKTSVVAKTRQLKAEYSIELAQDLKAVHGLDAEGELSNILSTEILAEQNREIIRTIYTCAKTGAQQGTATAGTFDLDVDSNGRWSVEKFKGLLFQIEREANAIAQATRRGKGNFIVCSSDVASALAMAGVLDYAPALSTSLNVDESSATFAGVLNGRYKVYIDPYTVANSAAGTGAQFFVAGYKGTSAFDAGLFYCPYVPLQLVRAVDQSTFQPKIGFKTRYGLVANPFTSLDAAGDGLSAGNNYYYRKVTVANLM